MAYTGNTQQQINYGSSANDGQGDPLRSAFIKTDDNFDAVWATGPVGSNITIVNNTVQVMSTNGNLVLRPNGVGVVQANAAVVPNATDLRDLGTANLRFRAAYIGTGGLEVTGNITANTFFGNGSQLTGITSSYGNVNVATLLAAFGSNTISTTGNVSANNFVGNGALLTGITNSYNNANVTSLLAAFGSNTIVTTGNITAGNVSAIDATADVVTFNTTAAVAVGVGQMAWNNTDGTLDIGMNFSGVVQQVGQKTYYVVRNDTGVNIAKGTALYCDGATAGSGRMTAAPMIGNGSIDAKQFLGLATDAINTGINGVVSYFGYLRGLDTRGTAVSSIAVGDETWAAGDQLYVHPTAAGKLTNVEPAAPNVKICVASIIVRNQSTGVLFVRPTTNLDISDHGDVEIITPVAGNFLTYAGNRWENTALDIALDTTPALGGNLAAVGFDISNVGNITGGNISTAGNVVGNNVNATTSLGLPVYANATVRDSTIAGPQPGMMIFVTGTGLQVRGATAWNTVAGTAT